MASMQPTTAASPLSTLATPTPNQDALTQLPDSGPDTLRMEAQNLLASQPPAQPPIEMQASPTAAQAQMPTQAPMMHPEMQAHADLANTISPQSMAQFQKWLIDWSAFE